LFETTKHKYILAMEEEGEFYGEREERLLKLGFTI
jgi:hypothetical protein